MSDIICITSRKLCKSDFYLQIEKIAKAQPRAIILREKDLTPEEYSALAKKVICICKKYHTNCILHNFISTSISLECKSIHLPLYVLKSMTDAQKDNFKEIGASCHSVKDAVEAESMGCTYITAGHIFDTDCKKGLPGRGLEFLKSVCESVTIPVYAVGGISKENYSEVKNAGAAGACIMSGLMTCKEPSEYIKEIENEVL